MANEIQEVKMGITQAGIDYVVGELDKKKEKGLKFPVNYSITNAMQSAFLMLREAENKEGKPLLSVCTQDSVVQSLMQMATQGLNPIKKQCYFVAYGKKCSLVPSYFGTLAILKRVTNVIGEPVANIIYKGDTFEYSFDLDTGETVITKHEQKLDNMDNTNIGGAYAIVRTENQKIIEIMNINQLKKAWAQGRSWQAAEKGGYDSKTHTNFTEEMAKKTVLNRACKKLINSTDDSSLMGHEFLEAYNDTESNDTLDVVAEQVAVTIEENANSVDFVEDDQAPAADTTPATPATPEPAEEVVEEKDPF